MAKLGFIDVHGADIGERYISKNDFIENFPNIAPAGLSPELFSWGINTNGQVGDGTTTSRGTPVRTVASTNAWRFFSCGTEHRGAITDGGVLWTWGKNDRGQLGDNSSTNRSSPVTTSGGGTNWRYFSAAKGTANTSFSVAIKTDGTHWAFGNNIFGQLGTNNTTSRSSPVSPSGGGTNWKYSSAGHGFVAAVKTDGTLWTWGRNTFGQLGTGTTTSRSSPGTTAGGGTDWKTVSVADESAIALKADGKIYTWGRNVNGMLGDGTTTNRSSPVTIVGGITNWKFVSCGCDSMAAITEDGTLWTWGSNNVGQLGDGTTTNRSSPVTTAGGGTTWAEVSILNEVGTTNTFVTAIKTNGALWLWGTNSISGTNVSSPVTSTLGGSTWLQVDGLLAAQEIEGWKWSGDGYN